MGSTTNFELTFNQAEVRSDGAHTNATAQQPATGGGGGGTVNSVGAGTNVTITGTAINPIVNVPTIPYADVTGAPTSLPPNGAAGGDLSGTYPNPTLGAIGSSATEPSTAARVPVVVIDTKGRVTSLTDEAINGVPYANITGTPSSLPPNGSAGGDLTGTYPNPTVNLLSAVTSILQTPVGYATGGNVQIRFDLGSYGNIGLTVNASFSPSGSGGLAAGSWQTLDLTNTTGGALTLTWNASWKLANGALPTTIAGGASYRIELRCGGSTEASVLASWEQTASAGLTVPASAVLLSSTTSTLLANLNEYNVQAYGAVINAGGGGAVACTLAINNAIDALVTAGGGKLVFPGNGVYTVNSLHAISVPCEICGMGQYTTIISVSGTNDGFTVSAVNSVYIHDLQLSGAGNSTNNTGINCTAGLSNGNFTRLEIVGFGSGIACQFTQNGMLISECTISCTHSITIGATGGNAPSIAAQSSEVMIRHCNLSGITNGIYSLWGNGVLIEGCMMASGGATAFANFVFPDKAGNTQADIWILGNHIECTTGGSGVLLNATAMSYTNLHQFNNIVINDNEYSQTGGAHGYFVSATSTGAGTTHSFWPLGNLVIVGNDVANAPDGGIYLTGVAKGIVAGNLITAGAYAIHLDNTCWYVTVDQSSNNCVGSTNGISDASYGHTVGTLQSATASGAGTRSWVTDALLPTWNATVSGTGAVICPVTSNGTNWVCG